MIVASLRLRTRTLEGGTDLLNPAMLQATQQLVIINFYDRAIRSSHPMSSAGLFGFKRYTRIPATGLVEPPNQKSGRRGTSTSRSGRIRRGFDAVGQARPPGRAVSRKGVLAARVQTGLTMTWDRMPTPLQGGLPSSMSNVKTQLTESAA
ncbi:hypothetical protein BDP67DRAFT_497187 [Colletotrichum lupini]|nr:hypothetical protein BDP67DRAFT_497187 [Colletotrichum lupini]